MKRTPLRFVLGLSFFSFLVVSCTLSADLDRSVAVDESAGGMGGMGGAGVDGRAL